MQERGDQEVQPARAIVMPRAAELARLSFRDHLARERQHPRGVGRVRELPPTTPNAGRLLRPEEVERNRNVAAGRAGARPIASSGRATAREDHQDRGVPLRVIGVNEKKGSVSASRMDGSRDPAWSVPEDLRARASIQLNVKPVNRTSSKQPCRTPPSPPIQRRLQAEAEGQLRMFSPTRSWRSTTRPPAGSSPCWWGGGAVRWSSAAS